MTARNFLSIAAMGLLVVGWGTRGHAEGDVTVVQPPPSSTAKPVATTAPDGTPVVHKSSHKKKRSSAVAGSSTSGTTAVVTSTSAATVPATSSVGAASSSAPKPAAATSTVASSPSAAKPVLPDPPVPVTKPTITTVILSGLPSPPPTAGNALNPAPSPPANPALGPTVETALPIARHTGSEDTYRNTVASAVPGPTILSQQETSYTAPGVDPTVIGSGSFPGAPTSRTHAYPWKKDIITTEFWIGEGATTISSTDNIGSAWDENWRSSNHGNDSPDDRQGYLPASHAPTLNPFYVALPFNDMAYPDQARRWLPDNWKPRYQDGKQVSTCKDRWVEIKNQQGDTCYAQWEDVGPLTSDHPEYVFGNERPDTLTRAGLDVSPAVAKYLGIEPEGRNRLSSWRFVDAEDVPPGYWLKYDEEALIYAAMHELNNKRAPDMDDEPSIQRSIAPTDDPSQLNANKKKVGAAKG